MSIAPTLQKYLDQTVTYDVITHDLTRSSMRTAQACHISGDRFAKGIVLRLNGRYMLAVLPASHHVRLADLKDIYLKRSTIYGMVLGEQSDISYEKNFSKIS